MSEDEDRLLREARRAVDALDDEDDVDLDTILFQLEQQHAKMLSMERSFGRIAGRFGILAAIAFVVAVIGAGLCLGTRMKLIGGDIDQIDAVAVPIALGATILLGYALMMYIQFMGHGAKLTAEAAGLGVAMARGQRLLAEQNTTEEKRP